MNCQGRFVTAIRQKLRPCVLPIRIEFEPSEEDREVYPQKNFSEIVALCNQEKISIIQPVYIIL